MKTRILLCMLISTVCGLRPLGVSAQYTRSLSEDIRTVRVVTDGDPLLPPVTRLSDGSVEVSFDQMSHAYTRYIYKVQFCNADWTTNEEVFESDYLSGFNGQPIEDYETSLNTTVLYTHYSLSFPNDNCRLLLPGNYRVQVFADEDSGDADPVLEACFSLLTARMSVTAAVSSNTDIDVNRDHQQVSFAVNYMDCRVIDPGRELQTVVTQNRRRDNAVVSLPPNIRKAAGAEWTHRRELIFPAGNEFRKFEILDVHRDGMGVDCMKWFEPCWHAALFTAERPRTYSYDEDANGIALVRHSGDEDNATQSEYLFVHFRFDSAPLDEAPYVCGLWTDGDLDEKCRMTYSEEEETYEVAMLLKQGYYNWQARVPAVRADGSGDQTRVGLTAPTEGDFYETENEYQILVYYRPQGERYDALVGYTSIHSR